MKNKNSRCEHSDEVNEMLGKVPSWIVRWGISLMAFTLLILVVVSLYIKIPETVRADITMTLAKSSADKRVSAMHKNFLMGCLYVSSSELLVIKKGQPVCVKVDSYPYMSYGVLKGWVYHVCDSVQGKGGRIDVVFPDGLVTTYRKPLKYIPGMDGKAEIITNRIKLFHYMFRSTSFQ
jgi:hypothetical protein